MHRIWSRVKRESSWVSLPSRAESGERNVVLDLPSASCSCPVPSRSSQGDIKVSLLGPVYWCSLDAMERRDVRMLEGS